MKYLSILTLLIFSGCISEATANKQIILTCPGEEVLEIKKWSHLGSGIFVIYLQDRKLYIQPGKGCTLHEIFKK